MTKRPEYQPRMNANMCQYVSIAYVVFGLNGTSDTSPTRWPWGATHVIFRRGDLFDLGSLASIGIEYRGIEGH